MSPIPSTVERDAARAEPSRALFSSLAETALRLLGKKETRPLGGLSRTRGDMQRALHVPLSAFTMVGLTEVQAKLADRWPALAERVHLIARNTIAKHLVRGDVFEQHGEDGYLVLFSTLGAAEAEFKSRVIAREIVEHLLGEGQGQALGVSVAALCTEIAATALAGPDRESAVVEALARGRPPASAPAAAASGSPPASPDSPAGDAAPSVPSSHPPDGETRAEARAVPRHAYSPVWDVKQMTLLRFRAFTPDLSDPMESGRTHESKAFQADLSLIRAVGEDLHILTERGRRLPITVPVQHTSLSSGSWQTQLHHVLAEMRPELRRLITLELCCPQESWTYACRTFLERIRPLGVSWSALFSPDRPHVLPEGNSGLRSVGANFSSDAQTEAERLQLLAGFSARARAHGLECTAYGLASRALVLGAIGAGFRFLSGLAIHADVPNPASAVRFNALDLYPNLTRRSRASP